MIPLIWKAMFWSVSQFNICELSLVSYIIANWFPNNQQYELNNQNIQKDNCIIIKFIDKNTRSNMMKFLTWNIKDGGVLDFNNPKVDNIDNILNIIKKENPDVIVIQEYQSEFYNELIRDGLNKLFYTHTVCEDHPDKTLRKRVLIASKEPFETIDTTTNILDYSKRNWREIIVSNNSVHVLGVHVPLATTTNLYGETKDNKREKKIFLDALKEKFIEYKNSEDPCMICGDFNLHEGAVYKEYLDDFANCLTEVTSKEATHGNYKFDYVFVNDAFKRLIKTEDIFSAHQTIFLDHSYLCIEIA